MNWICPKCGSAECSTGQFRQPAEILQNFLTFKISALPPSPAANAVLPSSIRPTSASLKTSLIFSSDEHTLSPWGRKGFDGGCEAEIAGRGRDLYNPRTFKSKRERQLRLRGLIRPPSCPGAPRPGTGRRLVVNFSEKAPRIAETIRGYRRCEPVCRRTAGGIFSR